MFKNSKGIYLITDDQIKEIVKATIAENGQAENQNQNSEGDQLLTIQEVTDLFQISKVTLHSWKNRGLLKSYRMGRRVYFKKNEIMSALSSKQGGQHG